MSKGHLRDNWMLMVATVLFLVAALGSLSGCAIFKQQTPPMEAFANRLVTEAVVPAVTEGLKEGVKSLTVQAGAQGINPTYVLRFEGKWVSGIEERMTIGIEGIAGQMQITILGEKGLPTP